MKEIHLVNSPLRVTVDDGDFELVSKHNWRTESYRGNPVHAIRSSTRPHVQLGRYILENYKGKLPRSLVVDHIDRNPLNCTKRNLRLASHSENEVNSNIRVDNISGYKGVSAYANGGYRARICINNTVIYLGIFKQAKDAAIAYNNAAIKHFGSFAKLNAV